MRKNFLLILFFAFALQACGVKAPPQPPLTPAEAEVEEASEKAREEKRKKQLEAIELHRKKIEEQKQLEGKSGSTE